MYRECVGIMLFNKAGKVFIAQRLDCRHSEKCWQMPQGGINASESVIEAATRELEEETSISLYYLEFVSYYPNALYYDIPKQYRKSVDNQSWIGQKQWWVLYFFQGPDTVINLDTKHPEFCSWKWESPCIVPDLVVCFKQKIYQELIIHFLPLIKNFCKMKGLS